MVGGGGDLVRVVRRLVTSIAKTAQHQSPLVARARHQLQPLVSSNCSPPIYPGGKWQTLCAIRGFALYRRKSPERSYASRGS